EVERLERRLLVLATIGSAGAVVGVVGNGWGNMTNVQSIAASQKKASAGGGPALRPTAFADPPGPFRRQTAETFFNQVCAEVNKQAQRLEGFADEFAAILSRQIDERG